MWFRGGKLLVKISDITYLTTELRYLTYFIESKLKVFMQTKSLGIRFQSYVLFKTVSSYVFIL